MERGQTIAAMEESCGTQTREISLNPSRNADLNQVTHSERAAEYLSATGERKKDGLCSITCTVEERMKKSALFYIIKLKLFL